MQAPDSPRVSFSRRLTLSPPRGSIRPGVVWLPVFVAVLLFPGCATKKQKYETVEFETAKLATPPHNMKPHEYPFDDWGRYRKDWVKPGASSGRSAPASRPTSSFSSSEGSSHAASAPSPAPAPKPAASPPPPKPKPAARYHTVVKGDTLFGIGRKYGVSVSAIKNTNGLRSDLIRIGQTLRISG